MKQSALYSIHEDHRGPRSLEKAGNDYLLLYICGHDDF